MIRIETENGKTKAAISGNAATTIADTEIIISAIYRGLCKNNKTAAKMFKMMIIHDMTDPDALQEIFGKVSKRKERNDKG